MGVRKVGGFVGEHERTTGEPIPEHIAAIIAFGFVFIHPFADGNGRIHRYLIHHILAKMKFTPQRIISPVSAAIFEQIDDYRKVLENYSHPLLDFIEWRTTKDHNVEVINYTADYYKYFDVTMHAEFLFDCTDYTIKEIIKSRSNGGVHCA